MSDVSKASIKIQREFLSFSNCIKHIEVTGRQKTSSSSSSSPPTSSVRTPARTPPAGAPYGAGRQPGETGSELAPLWGHLGGRHDDHEVGPSNDGVRVSLLVPSPFTAQFLRMKAGTSPGRGSSISTPTVKVSPPFSGSSVEILVPVSACQQVLFEVKFISPSNGVVGRVADIELPRLSDIPDFVPPLITDVLDVKFLLGGSHDLAVKSGSPIPDSCLLDYLEAVDAFNHRMEIIANQREEANTGLKLQQVLVQGEVEKTQAEILKQLGCVCTSPRLEITGNSEVGGVYLYHGLDSGGRPTYRSERGSFYGLEMLTLLIIDWNWSSLSRVV